MSTTSRYVIVDKLRIVDTWTMGVTLGDPGVAPVCEYEPVCQCLSEAHALYVCKALNQRSRREDGRRDT